MSATTDTTARHPNAESSHRPRVRMVQNFLIVWLDGAIDKNDEDYQNAIAKLREVSNTVNTFTDVDECIHFLHDIKTQKVFMISAGALGQITVPMVHDMAQIDAIYILCGNKMRHQTWAQHWSKIQGVFTDITPICEALKKAAYKCDQNNTPMSFLPTIGDAAGKSLDQLDQSFMYTQILKEILLTIDFEHKHFIDFITYCREQFEGNTAELRNVNKLENEYRRRTPIWWYTYPCFLYSTLNCALRTMEVDLIIKLGFFIRDLHEHITRLHSEQYPKGCHCDPFVVYRGQGLSETDFNRLMKTKGGLLSFNNFLSTTTIRQVSLNFARDMVESSKLVGILFVIHIDPSLESVPFANVHNVGCFPKEEEILFSMHSIFRVGEIKQLDGNNRLWQVDLTLTGDHDPQLRALTEYIREETSPHAEGWYRLGEMMIKLGHFDKAQEVYDELLNQITDDRNKPNIYFQLGSIKNNQGEYSKALSFHQKALEIYEKTLPPNHPNLATSYSNIGAVYDNMGEYSKALSFHQKALEIYEKTLPPNHPSLATSYSNIGSVYDNMGEYSKALSFHQKALEIYEKTLPPNHPSLATSYSNIGSVYDNMGEYSKALSFHQKALEIDEKTLPPNHPSLATSYNNIGKTYYYMQDYSKALSFYDKALEICVISLPSNHPDFGWYKNNIGMVFDKMGDYSKALSFYQRALDIGQHSLAANHPHLQLYRDNVENMKKKL